MRQAGLVVLCLGALAHGANAAESQFPYTAYTNTDDVYVRSGPGKNYYPTDKLPTGAAVEVYRHDPGGWYAIRPPKRSFSWVSARDVRLAEDGLAEVAGDGVTAHVGTVFSEVRDVIQVRLDRSEMVELFDPAAPSTGQNTAGWYKITPPAGEFRWISAKFVDRHRPAETVADVAAKGPHYVNPVSGAEKLDSADRTADDSADDHAGDNSESHRSTAALARGLDRQVRLAADDHADTDSPSPTRGASSRSGETRVAMTARSNRTADLAVASKAKPAESSAEAFQTELDDLDLALSVMVAEEPSVWTFDALQRRADGLMLRAETAIQRGRVRIVLTKLTRFEDLKRRYDTINTVKNETDRHNSTLSAGTPAPKRDLFRDDANRFDGQGRLQPVVAQRAGAAHYALVDANGQITSLIVPGPGVNLQPYLGRQIGVGGQRGFDTVLSKPSVTVMHITELDGPTAMR